VREAQEIHAGGDRSRRCELDVVTAGFQRIEYVAPDATAGSVEQLERRSSCAGQ